MASRTSIVLKKAMPASNDCLPHAAIWLSPNPSSPSESPRSRTSAIPIPQSAGTTTTSPPAATRTAQSAGHGADDIIKLVTDSAACAGAAGRLFSAGQKWSFIPKEKKGPHYLAVNADESEPGTFKDRYLIDYDPHRCSKASPSPAGPRSVDIAYIFIRGEYHRIRPRCSKGAIKEAYHTDFRPAGACSAPTTNSSATSSRRRRLHLRRRDRPAGSLEGKRGWPRNKPPFPAIAGAFARPTVINNVETLCLRPADHRARAGLVQVDGHQELARPQAVWHERPRQQAWRLRRRTGHHARIRDQ
jgi:hypothetical protein